MMSPNPSPADERHALVRVAVAADTAARHHLPIAVAEMLRAGASVDLVFETVMLGLVDRAAASGDLPRVPTSRGVIL